MPRTSERMVDELERLLERAGERGPYVLVGSGLGGYNARLFTGRFPAEVAGVVLVDTVTEDQPLLNATPLWLARTVEVAGALGVVRLKGGWTRHPPAPPELWPPITALRLRTTSFLTNFRERVAVEDSAAEVRAARTHFPDVPLVVMTPGPPRLGPSAPPEQVREVEARWRFWSDEHARIASTSPRGRHVVAQEANAPLPLTAPAEIAAQILALVRPAASAATAGGRVGPP